MKSIPELRAELADLRLRVRCDKANHEEPDPRDARRIKELVFQLADKLFFARLNHLKAEGKDTAKDAQLMRLSDRVDKALASL